jgi:hypothetical protein
VGNAARRGAAGFHAGQRVFIIFVEKARYLISKANSLLVHTDLLICRSYMYIPVCAFCAFEIDECFDVDIKDRFAFEFTNALVRQAACWDTDLL